MKRESIIITLLCALFALGQVESKQETAGEAPQNAIEPLKAEKPVLPVPVEPEEIVELPELINAPAELSAETALYDAAMDYYDRGGRRWTYKVGGREATKSQLVKHLKAEHGHSVDLEQFDHNTLQWIHSMSHEKENRTAKATGGRWVRVKVCGSNGCKYVMRWIPEQVDD